MFSKAFYERLGEQVTNELVELLNLIDGTYRSELREVNELNFARFEAAERQRFAEADARLERRFREMGEALDEKFESRLARIDARFAQLDGRISQIDVRFAQMETKLEVMRAGIVGDLTKLMTERLDAQSRLILLSWVTLLATILALRW